MRDRVLIEKNFKRIWNMLIIFKIECKYCITSQIIFSEKLYEQLIQDYMHLFSMHANIIIVLASILWQVGDQISEA